MEPKPLSLDTPCPCCQSRMDLAALKCPQCLTKVEAPLQTHEFMFLSEEDLQLLRIFIQFEGRIRDMEAPLGLSYPTIRNRISEFKERIFKTSATSKSEEPLDILSALDEGKISFEEALGSINQKKNKRKNP